MEKEVQREWGAWELGQIVHANYEWKRNRTREMALDAAHGGSKGQNKKEIVDFWLVYVPEKTTWFEGSSVLYIFPTSSFLFEGQYF